jgi:tetratricopeptide (TPR) repeat protein
MGKANEPGGGADRTAYLRRPLVLATALVALGLGAAVWFALRPVSPPLPREFDLAATDPEVAEAVREARLAVLQSPRSGRAWGRLGMILMTHDLRAEAVPCLEEAEQLEPDEPRWPYLQALALQMGDPARALVKLRRAAALSHGRGVPRLRLAEALLAQGELVEAEALFREANRDDPGGPRAQVGLAQVALAQGRFADSVPYLQAAAHCRPAAKRVHVLLAAAYGRMPGKAADADHERELVSHLADDPSWPDPYLEELAGLQVGWQARVEWANNLRRQGRRREARDVLREATALYPHSDWVWLSYGKLLLETEDYRAAEEAFRTAIRLGPRRFESHFQLGTALYNQKKSRTLALAEAAEAFRDAAHLTPTDARAHFAIGVCLHEQGDPGCRAQALAAYQAAVRHRPDYPDAHRNLGVLLAEIGREAEEAAVLQHLVGCGATGAVALVVRIEAVRHLRFASQAAPRDAEARQALARLLAEFPAGAER